MSELALYSRYLVFASIVVWLFPPIRQYKTRYFWFFLVLALTDPIVTVVARNFLIFASRLYVPLDILFFLSVIEYKKITFYKILFLIAIVGLGVYSFVHFWEYGSYFFTAVLFLVLVIIIKQSFQFVIEKGSINIFHVVLIFYQALNVFKSLSMLLYFSTGIWFFFVSTAVQILLGIFFALYREDDPRFLVRLTEAKQVSD